jgi:hypothetical protein
MSTFHLKLLAICLMIIDHIGAYLLPEVTILRIIGRLSFPLFAWLIANGAYHSRNLPRYALRLFMFALASQAPFALINNLTGSPFSTLNIFFTLAIGLGLIMLLHELHRMGLRLLVLLITAVIAQVIGAEYGAAGVLSIVAFYYTFRWSWTGIFLTQFAVFVLFFTLPLLYSALANGNSPLNIVALWQPVAASSALIVTQYNGRKGASLKYLFYIFYPLHLLILYWLGTYIFI